MTITDLCEEIKNWFDVSRHFGKFKIENGTIDLDFLSEGQFFRICDSTFNNGVYKYPCYCLQDEEFDGVIWAMAVPPAVLHLIKKINEWEETNKTMIDSPFTSESFGGYSYSKSTDDNGNLTWQNKFRKELNRWRKI